ncbi:MAG: response regulator transcription factor [Candidatus Omnitrophica bacterium]|nr:response regulator transcription factor [Candidatus Omnitrophota bacterium]
MAEQIEKLIAVVDDDPEMVKIISLNLKEDGFRVKGFCDAKGLFKFLDKEKPDLIILDLMLPGKDGMQICRELKNKERFSSIPVIMLSGKAEESSKVSGLDLGSDDYLVKPCSFNELKARIRAVLRRGGPTGSGKKLIVGKIMIIDPQRYEVKVKGNKVDLTTTEFEILECLSSRKGQVFTRDRILEYLWGEEKVVVDRTIDVHIRHLRKKLGPAGEFIKNVRGVGYKLEE